MRFVGGLAVLVLVSCGGTSKPPPPPPAVAVAVVDGGAITIAEDAAAPRRVLDVDLLHWTRATVQVSSNVDNPRDYPEHLVDGRADTAWNGKTGENGAIEFDVPASATIRQIELSAGYDKKTPAGDLFAMNRRIRKVRLSRIRSEVSQKIGEYLLDPEERLPQPIPLEAQGGHFAIEILETVPGTKKSWNETVISELHVMGDPHDSKLPHWRMPAVVVGRFNWLAAGGEFDESPSPSSAAAITTELAGTRTGPDAESLCAAYAVDAVPELALVYPEDRYPGPPPPGPYCLVGAPLAPSFKGGEGVRSLRSLKVVSLDGLETRLAITLDSGEVIMPRGGRLAREKQWVDGATTESARVDDVRIESHQLIVSVTHTMLHERYCMGGKTISLELTTELELRCSLEDKSRACTRIDRRQSCKGGSCASFGF